jgi:hypothetical protein
LDPPPNHCSPKGTEEALVPPRGLPFPPALEPALQPDAGPSCHTLLLGLTASHVALASVLRFQVRSTFFAQTPAARTASLSSTSETPVWAPARFPQGVVYVDDKVRAGIDTKIDARIPQALPSDAKELGRVLINRHQLNRCEECLLYPQ